MVHGVLTGGGSAGPLLGCGPSNTVEPFGLSIVQSFPLARVMQVFVRPGLATSCLRALARLWVLSCSAVSIYLFVRPGVAEYVFVHPSEASLFACTGGSTV